MNQARYKELLGRLLDDQLSATEANELAVGLEADDRLREDLRHHLVLWELWSQQQAPERSSTAFIAAWQTRLRAEAEGADVFAGAVRARLAPRGKTGQIG